MQAVVVTDPGVVRPRSVPDPSLSAHVANGPALGVHGALIRVLVAGVCGSDLHVIDDPATPAGTIVGHELVGEVLEIGSRVSSVAPGDLCLAPFNVSCGQCAQCRRGLTCHCVQAFPPRLGATYGMGMGWPGFQAEMALVPWADHNLVALPDGLSLAQMAPLVLATDVLPTALHAIARAGVQRSDRVYVAGAGPVGLAVASVARHQGAEVIIGEPNPERARRAAAAGFAVRDPSAAPLPEQLGGRLADVAVDCVGVNASSPARVEAAGHMLDALIDAVRHGGTVAMPGVYPGRLPAVPARIGAIWARSLTIVAGPTPARRYVARAIELLLTGSLPLPEQLNPHQAGLADADEVYRHFRAGALAKAVLLPAP